MVLNKLRILQGRYMNHISSGTESDYWTAKFAKLAEQNSNVWDFYPELLFEVFHSDPKNFLRNILYTKALHPQDYARSPFYWQQIRKLKVIDPDNLIENHIGNPLKAPGYRLSSPLLLQQAFTLSIFINEFPELLQRELDVVEVGGGYGSYSRLIANVLRPNSHTVVDLAKMLEINKSYLARAQPENPNIDLSTTSWLTRIDDFNRKPADGLVTLFATWSISEMDTNIRKYYCDFIENQSDLFFITFQKEFTKIDNSKYFEALGSRLTQFSTILRPLPGMQGNFIIMGKRR